MPASSGIGEISTGPQSLVCKLLDDMAPVIMGHGPARDRRGVEQAVLDHGAASGRARRLGRPAAAARAQPAAAVHGGDGRHRHRPVGHRRQGRGQAGVPPAGRHPHRRAHLRRRRVLRRGRAAARLRRRAGWLRRQGLPLGEAQVGRLLARRRGRARTRRARGDRARHPVHARHERALRRRHLHPLRARGRQARHLLARGAAALVPAAARLCDLGEGDPHTAGARRARMAPVHGARLHRCGRHPLRAVRLHALRRIQRGAAHRASCAGEGRADCAALGRAHPGAHRLGIRRCRVRRGVVGRRQEPSDPPSHLPRRRRRIAAAACI